MPLHHLVSRCAPLPRPQISPAQSRTQPVHFPNCHNFRFNAPLQILTRQNLHQNARFSKLISPATDLGPLTAHTPKNKATESTEKPLQHPKIATFAPKLTAFFD